MAKVKCAWFDFASCEGCQVELTNLGSTFLALLEHVELVEFREVMSEKTTGKIDIAFIEGSLTRETDEKRLMEIRERSNIVVAYGSCSVTGGINALKNHLEEDEFKKLVYAKDKDMRHLDSRMAKPISSVIKVDYDIPGCPISRDEFLRIVYQLVHQSEKIYTPSYPVCVECKLRETICRYEANDHCMGMVSLAGCGAPCPADGIPCEACRGLVRDSNQKSLEKVLINKGNLSERWAKDKSRMFTANFREEK